MTERKRPLVADSDQPSDQRRRRREPHRPSAPAEVTPGARGRDGGRLGAQHGREAERAA